MLWCCSFNCLSWKRSNHDLSRMSLYICPLNDLIKIFLYCHRCGGPWSLPQCPKQNSQSTSGCICASLLCSAAWSSLWKHKAKMFQQHVFVCILSHLLEKLSYPLGHVWWCWTLLDWAPTNVAFYFQRGKVCWPFPPLVLFYLWLDINKYI